MGIFDVFSKNPLDGQIQKYERLSSISPQNASIKNNLGDLYVKKGTIRKAAGCYKDAISLFLKDSEYDKAVATAKKAVSNDFFDQTTIEDIVKAFLSEDQKDSAISLFLLAAKKKLNTNRTYANDMFRKILDLDPENKEALSFFEKGKQTPDDVSVLPEGQPSQVKLSSDDEAAFRADKISTTEETPVDNKNQNKRSLPIDIPKEDTRKAEAKPEKKMTLPDDFEFDSPSVAALKDKFIAVAKENKRLESMLIQYGDIIKKLEAEKTDLSFALERASEKPPLSDSSSVSDELMKSRDDIQKLEQEKQEIERLLTVAKEEIEYKESLLMSMNDGKKESSVNGSLSREDKEVSAQEATALESEIAALRIDIDDLTTAMEEKIRENEELREKVDVGERAAAGVEADFNKKIDALSKELQQKEALLLDRSEAYVQEREEFITLKSQYESSEQNKKMLRQEISILEQDKRKLEEELNDSVSREKEKIEQSLQSGFRKIEQERDGLKERLGSVLEELTALLGEKTRLEDELNSRMKSSQEERDDLRNDIDELTSSMEDKIRENEEFKERISVLEEQIIRRESETKEKESVLIDELSRKEELLKEKANVFEKSSAEPQSLQVSNSELYQELDKLKTEIQRTTEDLADVSGERVRLEQELNQRTASYQKENAELRTDIDELTSTIESKLIENSELSTRIASLQDELSQRESVFNERIGSIMSELARKEELIQEKNDEFSGKSDEFLAVQAERSELQQERDVLEEEMVAVSSELAALKDDKSGLEKQLMQMKNELKEKEELLTGELSRKEEILTEQSEALQKTYAEIQPLRERIGDLEREQDQLRYGLGSTSEELAARTQEKVLLEEELKRVKEELKEKTVSLTGELVRKEELLIEKAEVFEKDVVGLNRTLDEVNDSLRLLKDENLKLSSDQEEIKNKLSEYTELYEQTDKDKNEMEDRLSDALKEILDLQSNNDRHLSVIANKDNEISSLHQKISDNESIFARNSSDLEAVTEKLKTANSEKEKKIKQLLSEKEELIQKIAFTENERVRLNNEKTGEISRIREQLGAAFMKIADIESSLKVSLNANIELRKKLEGASTTVLAKIEEEKVTSTADESHPDAEMPKARDMVVYQPKRNPFLYVGYGVLLIAILAGSILLYKNYYLEPRRQDAAPVPSVSSLPYNEIYERLTRSTASETIKFQGTLITELLLRHEDREKDLAQFDFNKFYYFKMNVSSLKEPLAQGFFNNPFASITLSDGKKAVLPSDNIKIEAVRIIYKREDPVTIVFFAAFPRESLQSPRQLELHLMYKGHDQSIIWDLRSLKNDGIVPQ